MTTLYSLADISRAVDLLEQRGINSVKISEISEKESPVIALAQLTTPESLDMSDFFVLLSHPEMCDSSDFAQIKDKVLKALKYEVDGHVFDEAFYEECLVSYESFKVDSGRFTGDHIAKTRIVPPNLNENLPPIVFVGGLNHKTPVYMKFLIKLALEKGQQVIAVDAPGNGASLHNGVTTGLARLWKTVDAALSSDESLQRGFVLMGHSLGSEITETLRKRSSLPIIHTVSLCPVGNFFIDEPRGQTMGIKFLSSAVAYTVVNQGTVRTKKTDVDNLYLSDEDQKQRDQLWDHINNEAWPQDFFTNAVSWMSKPSVWGQVEKTPDGRKRFQSDFTVVLAEKDAVMPNANQEAWKLKGAHVVEGASHSFLAGFDAEEMQRYAHEIISLLPDFEAV